LERTQAHAFLARPALRASKFGTAAGASRLSACAGRARAGGERLLDAWQSSVRFRSNREPVARSCARSRVVKQDHFAKNSTAYAARTLRSKKDVEHVDPAIARSSPFQSEGRTPCSNCDLSTTEKCQ